MESKNVSTYEYEGVKVLAPFFTVHRPSIEILDPGNIRSSISYHIILFFFLFTDDRGTYVSGSASGQQKTGAAGSGETEQVKRDAFIDIFP